MEQPHFKFTVDRNGLPLIVWGNPPGLWAEFTPDQLRRLTADLLLAVDLAEAAVASVSSEVSLA